MNSNFFAEELYQMRENYKKQPLNGIHLRRPKWLDFTDPLFEIYTQKSNLLQQGEIVYANIVQANTLLFKSFPPYNCPAQIIYSTHPYANENPECLLQVAQNIYRYKGQDLNLIPEEWREMARVVTDEYDRSKFNFSLQFGGHLIEFNMVTTMVYRKLLPKRKLIGNIFPIFTTPESNQVLILPKKYWSKKFTEAWENGLI